MKRFLTRFFAVLLSVCLAVSALMVTAVAIAEAAFYTVGGIVLNLILQCIADGCGDFVVDNLSEFGENVQDIKGKFTAMSLSEGDVICHYDPYSNTYEFYVPSNSELSEFDRGVATTICDYLNENFEFYESNGLSYYIMPGIGVADTSNFWAEQKFYAEMKKGVYNAVNGYIAKEVLKDKLEQDGQTINSIHDLENALGDSFPRYDFDFVGPIPTLGMTTPNVDRISALSLNGFTFTPTISYTIGHKFTEAEASYLASFAPSYLRAHYLQKSGYWVPQLNSSSPAYSYTYYYLTDDGQIYFGSGDYIANGTTYESRTLDNSPLLKDATGRTIKGGSAEAIEIYSHIVSVGVCMNTGNDLQSSIPVNVSAFTDEDFKTTTGGEEVIKGIPRSVVENVIGGAVGMGLIAADAPLTISADGTITAADGIPIDKLGEILEAIQSGNLNFETIEDYLSLISTLVGNGNLTMTEQQKILENVNTNTKAGAKDLAQIRAALQELTDALTKEYEWEAEDTDGDISWITAEHTGLNEAKEFVDKIEFVNQSTKLLGNLFDKYEKADSQAPKFSFYWDSDKDGDLEKYTVLDLSFMEQQLTNSNIDDKRRFQSPMTIRGFVRYLIVFLSYVGFVIKILKRLPSMIGGVGDASEDIDSTIFKKGN